MPACGRLSARMRRVASSITATAALSSAPRIVPARVADDPVVDDRLDRRGRRNGVEVRAEEQRLAVGRRLEPRVEVPHRRAGLRPGGVLVDLEPAVAQEPRDPIGDRPLLSRRAGDRRELGEQVEDVRRHRPWILRERRPRLFEGNPTDSSCGTCANLLNFRWDGGLGAAYPDDPAR